MGVKTQKTTENKNLAAELMAEKLSSFGGITIKNMFGGQGIFKDGKMFCIVDAKENYYFKANDSNKLYFEKEKWVKHSKMPYFSVPEKVFNDIDTLMIWAEKSMNN